MFIKGEILGVTVSYTNDHIAFIQFALESALKAAVRCHDGHAVIAGCSVRVYFARTRSRSPPSRRSRLPASGEGRAGEKGFTRVTDSNDLYGERPRKAAETGPQR